MTPKSDQKEGCCSYPFLKSVLRVFNIIFVIAGLGVIAVVLWTLFDKFQYVWILNTINYQLIIFSLLTAGGLVIITSFFGCCTLRNNSKPLLLLYIFLLVLIFLIEAMVGILGFIYLEVVHTELDSNLNSTFLTTYKIEEDKTKTIDFIQENFHCCGAVDFGDWQHSQWKSENFSLANKVPDSCCRTIMDECGKRDHPSNIYYDGCLRKIEDHLRFHLSIMSAVGLGISVLQIFGIIFACCLYCHLKDDYGDIG